MALKKCLTVLSSSALFMFSATSKTKYSMEKHSGRVMTDEEPRPLSPDEKGQVLQLIKLIRDSPRTFQRESREAQSYDRRIDSEARKLEKRRSVLFVL